jgi:signal transduction histidine kinase
MHLEYIYNLLWLVGIATTGYLTFTVIAKMDNIKQLQAAIDKLKKSLEEMDEQAKLIVRTDIELNRAQEELDKKISGLYALQRMSRAISTTLEENQIFKMIEANHLEDLGFEKGCAFLWSASQNKFILQLTIGYAENDIEPIKSAVNSDKNEYLRLIANEKTISSISESTNPTARDKITGIFNAASFVISPILLKEGNKGFLLVGTDNAEVVITEGDEELITILSNQIGQALENARLFEKTWQAQQELEKKVEERTHELTLALEEVKKINKRKSDFISSVSHELRTPLTSIKGYAAILLEEKLGALPAAVKERLERVNRHTNELVNMVNDLLDIARIESGKITLNLQPHGLKNIIAGVSDLIMIQCKNKNIELIQDIQEDLPDAIADRGQIERVFINLLGNAVKFTPLNGKITIKARANGKTAQVDISDTGIGIPPEALTMIFEEFYRVDNPINEQVKGTGLGLSLVKHIIEAHKGKIWVESKVGQGSTFSFTLPLS